MDQKTRKTVATSLRAAATKLSAANVGHVHQAVKKLIEHIDSAQETVDKAVDFYMDSDIPAQDQTDAVGEAQQLLASFKKKLEGLSKDMARF